MEAINAIIRSQPVGASVNSIPSSFEGIIGLPANGVVDSKVAGKKDYDFTIPVKTGKKSSRLVVDIEGTTETEDGQKVSFIRKSAVLWGTSIVQLQDRIKSMAFEGDKVQALLTVA